jgi:hypothetical protein
MDDFLGSALNSSRWSGSAPVANSIATIATNKNLYPITSLMEFRPYPSGRIRLAAKLAIGTNAQMFWHAVDGNGNVLDVDFGYPYNGDTNNHFECSQAGTGSQLYATVAYPDTNYHVYEVEWDQATPYAKAWKDGALEGTQSYNYVPFDVDSLFAKLGGNSGYLNSFTIDWLAGSMPSAYMCSLTLGSQTLFNNDPVSDYGGSLPVSNDFYDETNGWFAVSVTGNQTLTIKVMNNSSYRQGFPVHIFFDDLMIMADKTVMITGLLGGQKIELYNSGGTLLYSWTSPSTGTNGTLVSDITGNITSAYGLLGYFKVYDTNGTSLLYTSSTAAIWGGDVYNWVPNTPIITITTVSTQIYVAGSGLTPYTTILTVTLTDANYNPLSGRSIQFTPNLGTCSPASASTDANGHATTTFTAGASPGLAGVLAQFLGDATYGAASVQQLLDIYLQQPVINPAKGFQVFIEGQEIVAASGNYLLSTNFQPQAFQVVTPVMSYAIGGWWLIQIYRYGVLEFTGRILGRKRTSGINPQTTITGVDNKIMLQRRVVNAGYTDDPKNIINSLLNNYPCGVSPGTLVSYGNTITLAATWEVLFDALSSIQSVTGWLFRLNASQTLDFGSTFGQVQNVQIVLGVNATLTDNEEDWTQLNTSVTVVGSGSGSSLLVAQASDPVSTLAYGLIETVSLQKSITSQGALNLAAAQLLTSLDQTKITITVDFVDLYPTGTYGPFDTLNVTDNSTGLSGAYQVFTLKRDLTQPNYAELTLTHLPVQLSDIMQALRSNVKDLSL